MVSIQNMLAIGSSSGMVTELPSFPKPLMGYVNIALSHCTVKNACLHNYTKALDGIPLSWFQGYDIAMLGDVHLQSVKFNKKTGIYYGYPGSLVQQDFGESIFNHGYLEWNINESKQISVEKKHVFNPYAKVNAKVIDDEIFVNAKDYIPLNMFLQMDDLPKHIHIRLYAKINNVQFRNIIVETFRDVSISAHVDIIGTNNVHDESNEFDVSHMNLQSLNSNETLIEFVESVYPTLNEEHPYWKQNILSHTPNQFELPMSDTYPMVIQEKIKTKNDAIRKYIDGSSSSNEQNFMVNILKIHEIRFDWILAFGKGNAFHFKNNRVVLINAPNGYGKSAFFECIVLGLFGEPVPSRYNKATALSILNKKKPFNTDTSNIYIEFSINHDHYKVNRKFYEGSSQTKDVKRLLAKNVELYKNDQLIKTGANVVNEYISNNLCSVKDFLLSTMITQNSDNDFFKLKLPDQISLLDSVLHIDRVNDLVDLMKNVKKEYKDILNHIDTYIKSKTPDTIPDESEYEAKKQKYEAVVKKLKDTEEELSELENLPKIVLQNDIDYKQPTKSCDFLKERYKQLTDDLLLLRVQEDFDNECEYVDDITVEQFLTNIPLKPREGLIFDMKNNIQNCIVAVRNAKCECECIQEELDVMTHCGNPHKPEETEEQYTRFIRTHQHLESKELHTEKIQPTKPSCSYNMIVSIKETFLLEHNIQLFDLSQNDIDTKKHELQVELQKYDHVKLEEPPAESYEVSKSYMQELEGKQLIQFNKDCWACTENSTKLNTKEESDFHLSVIHKWEQYNKYLKISLQKQKILKEIDEIDNLDKIREEYQHICEMFAEHEKWSQYEMNKSLIDERIQYIKELEKWNMVLPKIKKYNSWKKQVDELNFRHSIATQELADVQYILQTTYEYQRRVNKALKLRKEIRNVEEQLSYFCKRSVHLKHERDVYIRQERELFMYITRHHDKQDVYLDFKQTEINLCEFTNQICTHMTLFDKLTTLFKKYKSWLYNEKVLPVLVDTTNKIVSSIFADRTLELKYKFHDNTLLWSVLDEDNHVHMEKLSGAQSFAVSLGFRLALSSIGISKFKCNQLFIDEGFCSFDQNNLLHVPNLIKNLKTMFDEIILVTHLEEIKNSTDFIVNISRERGISYIYH
jgi:DNA repair exonuclease SbcCD ATPase subunit